MHLSFEIQIFPEQESIIFMPNLGTEMIHYNDRIDHEIGMQ